MMLDFSTHNTIRCDAEQDSFGHCLSYNLWLSVDQDTLMENILISILHKKTRLQSYRLLAALPNGQHWT